jgi:hypothetical protein
MAGYIITKFQSQFNPDNFNNINFLDTVDVAFKSVANIFTSIKMWQWSDDKVLNLLCNQLIDRKLLHIEISNKAFAKEKIGEMNKRVQHSLNLNPDDASYFVISDSVSNNAYKPGEDKINLLYRDGTIIDIADAADQLNISVLSNTVEKFFMCYPKECVVKD